MYTHSSEQCGRTTVRCRHRPLYRQCVPPALPYMRCAAVGPLCLSVCLSVGWRARLTTGPVVVVGPSSELSAVNQRTTPRDPRCELPRNYHNINIPVPTLRSDLSVELKVEGVVFATLRSREPSNDTICMPDSDLCPWLDWELIRTEVTETGSEMYLVSYRSGLAGCPSLPTEK